MFNKEQLEKLQFTGEVVTKPKTYGWYKYNQNNSGGSFVIDDHVSVTVMVQASNAKEAEAKAESIGIYFYGCEDGRDCSCCGDRWYRADDRLDNFTVYHWKKKDQVFDNVRDYAQALANNDVWAKSEKPSVIVYFADGSVERFIKENNK